MRCLVFILLIAAAFAEDDKIVGWHECTPHSQPHQVSLTYGGVHYCGGALLNENWVVSAALCYLPRIQVRLGEHNIGVNEGTEQFIDASHIIRHPKYSSLNNDIMLIKLSKPATLNQYVQPVALPTVCTPAGATCLDSAWGSTSSSNANGNNLQCLNVHIFSDKDCYNPGMINTNFCVALTEGDVDSCEEGDPGGPVVCHGELHGIILGCIMKGVPGLATKVCRLNDWLETTMASY